MERPLSELLKLWRAERPDEWTMDEFIREAERMEKQLQNTSSNSDYKPCIMCRGCQHECKTEGNIAECNDYLHKHGA